MLSIAFDDVSVLVEQFAIEFRLASFTVKSRRYVDFSGAGFVVPGGAPECFAARMEALFALYGRLLSLGVPREDARFVLPYCFRKQLLHDAQRPRVCPHGARHALRARFALGGDPRAGRVAEEQFELVYPGMVGDGEARSLRKPPRSSRAAGPSPAAPACSPAGLRSLIGDGGKVCRGRKQPESLLNAERPRALSF